MITAKHHPVIDPLFKKVTLWLINRRFSSVTITPPDILPTTALLILANHISWWDGFWIQYLNLKHLHRPLFFMMHEEQLKKHWYFRYTGGYSIKKKSRSILESLDHTVTLLNQSGNAVFLFPQGKIHSLYEHQIQFEKGISYVVKNITNTHTQILFVANLIDYFAQSRPHLFIYTHAYTLYEIKNLNLEQEYNQFFTRVVSQHRLKSV